MKLHVSDKKGVPIQEGMIGLFFEDINYAADGGLYAEMIENRSFEFVDCSGQKGDYYTVHDCGYGWNPTEQCGKGKMEYVMGSPVHRANPHYLRFTADAPGQGFWNKAYDGIYLEKGKKYKVSFYARTVAYHGDFRIAVEKIECNRDKSECDKDNSGCGCGKADDIFVSYGEVYYKLMHIAEEKGHFWQRHEVELTALETVKVRASAFL